ncbi:hypothetical protein KUTeg_010417 [Tegillarca granosa]|uniref:Major facilitator superfamily (MFS) profile domain-containing protein n=1 Tax=Tegillarca granosa TaxID=220873 RepID=A0ABQ9F6P8_TEGGR|nr:hypothetical protein KUTeg_010417 [Tegillarca granosa]
MFNRFVKFTKGDKYEDLAGDNNIDMDITDPAMRQFAQMADNERDGGEVGQPTDLAVIGSGNSEAVEPQEDLSCNHWLDSLYKGFFYSLLLDSVTNMVVQVLHCTCHSLSAMKTILNSAVYQHVINKVVAIFFTSFCLITYYKLYPCEFLISQPVVFAGMMFSSGFWGSVCDKYGRRTELILCSVFTCYFGILSAFSPNFIWILILRGCVGFGIGGAPQSVTLYAEFLPSASRATCVVLVEIFWALGACFEWLPESARYDITRGQVEKALATIERIAKENGKTDASWPQVEEVLVSAFSYYGIVLMTTELFETSDGCHGTAVQGKNVGYPDNKVFLSLSFIDHKPNRENQTNPEIILYATNISILEVQTQSHCHMMDIQNPITSISSSMKVESSCFITCKGLTTSDYVDLTWTTFAEFPGLFVTVITIEKIGRKPVLTFFLFVARAFISGAFQAAYVYTPEVYPTSMRAIGLGSCSGMARIGAIITPFVAQIRISNLIFALFVNFFIASEMIQAMKPRSAINICLDKMILVNQTTVESLKFCHSEFVFSLIVMYFILAISNNNNSAEQTTVYQKKQQLENQHFTKKQ